MPNFCFPRSLNSAVRLLIVIFLLPSASAQCGSLVTYRQHADLLQNAPQCLRNGCTAGQNSTTISSPCPSTSPCSVYWSMFVEQFDQKHTWCTACSSDLACRISGWPVLNATAMCDTAPNQLLFGAEEGCCTQDEEPFQLAEWTGKLCNQSEWRQPFDYCGGMACLDWREWIMPWNWTVRNENLPADQQACKALSEYLSVYAVEHFFWLFFSIVMGGFRLWIARHEEKNNRNVLRYFFWSFWTGFTKTFKQKQDAIYLEGEDLRPPLTDQLRWGFPVVMGVFLAGVQLGFNFIAANIIKQQPGYEDVPLVLLAFLFCCRPRLSWLSCVLALVSEDRLIKIFKFRRGGDGLWAAKLVLSSVAVTSAVTEAIMQLMGAYFLGRTAQIGQQRDFYLLHALRPKFHGRDARHMYLGALFWLILCIPLLVVWFLVALFFSQIYAAVSSWRRSIFAFLRPKLDNANIPELAKRPVDWLLNYIDPEHGQPSNPQQPPTTSRRRFGNQVLPAHDDDLPLPIDQQSVYDQPIPYGGPASGDLFHDQPMPHRHSSRRSRYAQLTQSEPDDQPMPRAASGTHRTASAGYAHAASGVQRRTPSGTQYNSLAQQDRDADQILPLPSGARARPEMRQLGRDGSRHSLISDSRQETPPGSSSNGSSSTPRRSDYTQGVSWKWKDWEGRVIFAGAFLGMLAYASQWLFWDGFVKAAGDRFCPPSMFKVGAVWWGGALLYVGGPFLGY